MTFPGPADSESSCAGGFGALRLSCSSFESPHAVHPQSSVPHQGLRPSAGVKPPPSASSDATTLPDTPGAELAPQPSQQNTEHPWQCFPVAESHLSNRGFQLCSCSRTGRAGGSSWGSQECGCTPMLWKWVAGKQAAAQPAVVLGRPVGTVW